MCTKKLKLVSMHSDEKEYWKEVIELINSVKYAHIHKTYDSKEGMGKSGI